MSYAIQRVHSSPVGCEKSRDQDKEDMLQSPKEWVLAFQPRRVYRTGRPQLEQAVLRRVLEPVLRLRRLGLATWPRDLYVVIAG